MSPALDGIRIADFTEYIAGPYCTMVLADLGADVIKVEPPGGDRWRKSLPVDHGEGRGFLQVNRGKRSVVIDLKRTEGRAVAYDLIRKSDAAVVNMRPAAAERLKIDYASLSKVNPRLIYCQLSGFGNQGPYAHRASFDFVAQAASGILVHEGSVGQGKMGVTTVALGDYSAGVFMVIGIVSALLARERTGQGQKIETNLLDAALASQYRPLLSVERYDAEARREYLKSAEEATKAGAGVDEFMQHRREFMGQGLRNIYYQAHRTKDGYIAVACLNNNLRRKLRDILGIEDPTVDGQTYRGTSREDEERLRGQAAPVFLQRTTQEWFEALDKEGVPCGPVNAPEQVYGDPQVQANGSILSVAHETLGELLMSRHPLRFSDTPVGEAQPPPLLGSSTRQVLSELGYAKETIERLMADGVTFE